MSDLTPNAALGWLVVGLINDHFPHPQDPSEDDPELGTPGCIINCGPCGALYWLSSRRYRRARIENLILATGYNKRGWVYWDDVADTLRWDWFRAYWARHKTCGMSNGVPTGCDFEPEPARPA
jgi:hypothetical protein